MSLELSTIASVLTVVVTAVIAPIVVARLRARREAAEVAGLDMGHAERIRDAAMTLVAPLEREVQRLSARVEQLEADLQASLDREQALTERVSELERQLRDASQKEAELATRLAESRMREAGLTERVKELERQNEELGKRLQAAHEEIERLKAVLGIKNGTNSQ